MTQGRKIYIEIFLGVYMAISKDKSSTFCNYTPQGRKAARQGHAATGPRPSLLPSADPLPSPPSPHTRGPTVHNKGPGQVFLYSDNTFCRNKAATSGHSRAAQPNCSENRFIKKQLNIMHTC